MKYESQSYPLFTEDAWFIDHLYLWNHFCRKSRHRLSWVIDYRYPVYFEDQQQPSPDKPRKFTVHA